MGASPVAVHKIVASSPGLTTWKGGSKVILGGSEKDDDLSLHFDANLEKEELTGDY